MDLFLTLSWQFLQGGLLFTRYWFQSPLHSTGIEFLPNAWICKVSTPFPVAYFTFSWLSYIYIYIYIYICIYACVYTYRCIYRYMFIYIYTYTWDWLIHTYHFSHFFCLYLHIIESLPTGYIRCLLLNASNFSPY